jgi:hypothetical protein
MKAGGSSSERMVNWGWRVEKRRFSLGPAILETRDWQVVSVEEKTEIEGKEERKERSWPGFEDS